MALLFFGRWIRWTAPLGGLCIKKLYIRSNLWVLAAVPAIPDDLEKRLCEVADWVQEQADWLFVREAPPERGNYLNVFLQCALQLTRAPLLALP